MFTHMVARECCVWWVCAGGSVVSYVNSGSTTWKYALFG